MIAIDEYINNPCGTLSIPYWKAKSIIVPGNMKIVHEKDFSEELLSQYNDEKYFRLYHSLKGVKQTTLPDYHVVTAETQDVDTIINVINNSYTDIKVDCELLKGYMGTAVYDSELWILAINVDSKECVGCGIADYDSEVGELALEWIQVLPDYRNRGLGKMIVNELLYRMKDIARFATVSGKVDNLTNPEMLYRRCGFSGNDVWHILTRK